MCLGHCLRDGVVYPNGHNWTNDETTCEACTCRNSVIDCTTDTAQTNFNGHQICESEFDCPSDSNCLPVDVNCVGDSCSSICSDSIQDRSADNRPCADHRDGSSDGCVVVDIDVDGRSASQICDEFGEYVRDNVAGISSCSDVDCWEDSSRRRRETHSIFRVVIDVGRQIERSSEATLDVVHNIESTFQQDKAAGTLPGELSAIQQVTVIVNGGWGVWYESTECSESCGGGVLVIKRDCSNPSPANGGLDCVGEDSQQIPCNEHACSDALTGDQDKSEDSGSIEWLLPTMITVAAVSVLGIITMITIRHHRRNKKAREIERIQALSAEARRGSNRYLGRQVMAETACKAESGTVYLEDEDAEFASRPISFSNPSFQSNID
ncbi:thrombospondin-1-like [Saccoglossus kowalevskii]